MTDTPSVFSTAFVSTVKNFNGAGFYCFQNVVRVHRRGMSAEAHFLSIHFTKEVGYTSWHRDKNMADGEFRVSEKERERLVAKEVAEFPIETPKYTTYLLNPAINLSQSNRSEVVGQMSDITEEFREQHPEGNFEDWIEFYFKKYGGEEQLEEATEMVYPMVEKMKKHSNRLIEI